MTKYFNPETVIRYSAELEHLIVNLELLDDVQAILFKGVGATKIGLTNEEIINSVLNALDIKAKNFDMTFKYNLSITESLRRKKLSIPLRLSVQSFDKLMMLHDLVQKDKDADADYGIAITAVLNMFKAEMR